MAKFIKSFFNTSERRRNSRYEENEEDRTNIALDGRRKLSISRSGRMRQANKKRHSLSLELYSQEMQMTEKPKSTDTQPNLRSTVTEPVKSENKQRSHSVETSSPDEEIDIAFEIINKTLTTEIS